MDDIINEFIEEAREGLETLDTELVNLEQDPENQDTLGNIFRVMHTIKGACGFLGLARLEKIAHAGENILGKFRDGEIIANPEGITLVLKSVDKITEIVDYLSENGDEPEGSDDDVIAQLNLFASGGAAPLPKTLDIAEADEADSDDDFSEFFQGDDDLDDLIAEMGGAAPVETNEKDPAEDDGSSATAEAPSDTAVTKDTSPKKSAQKPKKEASPSNQSIRVNLGVLEKIMQMVSELVLSRNQLIQIGRAIENNDFQSSLHLLSYITSELQEQVMQTRMQPIGSAWSKFPRLVRDLSHDLNKKINLEMVGEDTELDRQLLEAIRDPLTHMVRNSCDHGIETPEERIANGKEGEGTLKLSAFHEGSHIVIDIEDDGKGINTEVIKDKALKNGLVTEAELEVMPHKQILQFIFHAGLSTAEHVTNVSGRGVGMDVVRTNIEKIGGTIDLNSTLGKGSKISVKIPLTLAIISVLIVESKGENFALPQINVKEMIQVGENSAIQLENIHEASVIRLRGSLLPILTLSDVLGLNDEPTDEDVNTDEDAPIKSKFIVVCSVGGVDFGLLVDKIHNIEEIVVKPVSAALKSVSVFAGNTILGNGKIIMILDPNTIIKSIGNLAIENANQSANNEASDSANNNNTVSFLLFNYNDDSPKAIPMELIWRLERVKTADIEYSDSVPVLQYREKLMRILAMDPALNLDDKESLDVIVLLYDEEYYGLPVGEIIDIVDAEYDIKLNSENDQYIGSMVINGSTTDVINAANLMSQELPESDFVTDKSYNVLFVDDSPFFSKMITPFLTDAGYKVTVAEDGISAMKKIESTESHFDIIITDLQMPHMDGFEFTEACKALPKISETPVIGFTSLLEDNLAERCKESGMITCILKNNRTALLEAMADCLSHTPQYEQA